MTRRRRKREKDEYDKEEVVEEEVDVTAVKNSITR